MFCNYPLFMHAIHGCLWCSDTICHPSWCTVWINKSICFFFLSKNTSLFFLTALYYQLRSGKQWTSPGTGNINLYWITWQYQKNEKTLDQAKQLWMMEENKIILILSLCIRKCKRLVLFFFCNWKESKTHRAKLSFSPVYMNLLPKHSHYC